MHINLIARSFDERDGYGRFARRLTEALRAHPEQPTVLKLFAGHAQDNDLWPGFSLTVSPPFDFKKLPKTHWVYTMTEGSEVPDGWTEMVHETEISHIITPSVWCTKTFGDATGIDATTIKGGIDPREFNTRLRRPWPNYERPYTFLALGDRGSRKGWTEVWQAFFALLDEGHDIRLIIKSRTMGNSLIDQIASGDIHKNIKILNNDFEDMVQIFRMADCAVMPSRSEGWGMPHREAAAFGLPVIATRFSGLDDELDEWAYPIDMFKIEDIPSNFPNTKGQWCVPNIGAIVGQMRWCSLNRKEAHTFGTNASTWLHTHRTWFHTADNLIRLMKERGVWR